MVIAIYKLGLFENIVIRIMFEIKTEEIIGKGCVMWGFIIYTACQVLRVSKNSGKVGEECGTNNSIVLLENNLSGNRGGKKNNVRLG